MIDVNVIGGKISREEIDFYIDCAEKSIPKSICAQLSWSLTVVMLMQNITSRTCRFSGFVGLPDTLSVHLTALTTQSAPKKRIVLNIHNHNNVMFEY